MSIQRLKGHMPTKILSKQLKPKSGIRIISSVRYCPELRSSHCSSQRSDSYSNTRSRTLQVLHKNLVSNTLVSQKADSVCPNTHKKIFSKIHLSLYTSLLIIHTHANNCTRTRVISHYQDLKSVLSTDSLETWFA